MRDERRPERIKPFVPLVSEAAVGLPPGAGTSGGLEPQANGHPAGPGWPYLVEGR